MWKRVNVGGVDLRETWVAEQSGAVVGITGQESFPPSPRDYVEAVHANITARLDNPVVPVTFGDKYLLDGFYRVTAGQSVFDDEANGGVVKATWSMTLERLGSGSDLELESTVPLVGRVNNHAITPVYWHAPPIGATGYLTGSGSPTGTTDRLGADGTIRVHTGIPTGTPTWAVDVAEYLEGSVRLLDEWGNRRVGVMTPELDDWELTNGLVRVKPRADGALLVACWDPELAAWSTERPLLVAINDVLVAGPAVMTVIRNDPEQVAIRQTFPTTTGRVAVDISLRRGARTIAGTVKRHGSAIISVIVDHAEAITVQTGGIMATTADAAGNRFVLGSPVTHTTGSAPGLIRKTAVLKLDFFAGHQVGTSPVSGDAFAALAGQYIGSAAGERVRVVHR